MSLDRLFTVAGSLVMVAMVATIVRRGDKAAQVIAALGLAFGGALRAAQGL